jgi:hypothetical protein
MHLCALIPFWHKGKRTSKAYSGTRNSALNWKATNFFHILVVCSSFTIGMEGGSSLALALSASVNVGANDPSSKLAFDPYLLRKELKHRHDVRLHRLICLLRITELVQSLGQPISGTLAGMFSRDVIRPIMRITPDFIKTPIFNAVLKYSLGLPNNGLK